jgi:CPA1 family monovalent cation:H+ antiporter
MENELYLAEGAITTTAVDAIPELADEHGISSEVRDRVSRDYAEHLSLVEARRRPPPNGAGPSRAPEDVVTTATPSQAAEEMAVPRSTVVAAQSPLTRDEEYRRLRLALLDRKREVLVRLRREGTIDDSVARQVQTRIDLEELRLTGVEPLD